MADSLPPDTPLLGPTQHEVLQRIEGDYFLDYALFTGAVREYIVRTLEAEYKGSTNNDDWHRRLLLIAIYREEYTAYEDVGALLYAFLSAAGDASVLPLHRILHYRPAHVRLASLLTTLNVGTPAKLHAALKLSEWVPADWQAQYPAVDLPKVLKTFCQFVVDDCANNQKDYGVVGFNKIKHGLLLVPSARNYMAAMPDSPAMLFPTIDAAAAVHNPVTVQAVPHDEDAIEQRLRVVHFVQIGLRLLAFLHVLRKWPDTLEGHGFKPAITGFGHLHLTDVRDVAERVTHETTLAWTEP